MSQYFVKYTYYIEGLIVCSDQLITDNIKEVTMDIHIFRNICIKHAKKHHSKYLAIKDIEMINKL